MFGFTKPFAITLFIAFILGWKLGFMFGLSIIIFYALIVITWRIMTR